MNEDWDWQIGDTVAVCAPFERRDPMWGGQVTNRGQIVAFEALEAQPHWQEDVRWFSWPPDTQVAVVRFGDGSVGRFVKHDFPALRCIALEEWERACRLHDRARERLDRPFSPWQLDDDGLDEALRRRWQACVAARRAGHLRLLAQRLVEREALGAAPMRCEVLHPLLRGPALALPAWMAWTGSLVARPDAPRTAGDVRKQPVQAPAGEESARRRRRLAAWATRVWQWCSPAARVGLARARAELPAGIDPQRPLLWLQPWEGQKDDSDFPAAYYTLRRVVAAREDLRWRLQADSAPLLLALAQHLERAHGLGAQPALWFDRPKGWLHGAARDLSALLFGRRAGGLVSFSWQCKHPLELDWLAPQVHPEASQWPGDVLQAVEVIRQRLHRIATQRGIEWSEARAVIWGSWRDVTHIDDSWCRWRLETHTPFARLDSWINHASELHDGADHDWLPLPWWPDASPAQRGPGWRRVGWFEPPRRMIRWRSKAFARRATGWEPSGRGAG
jgi:hypothetical protein